MPSLSVLINASVCLVFDNVTTPGQHLIISTVYLYSSIIIRKYQVQILKCALNIQVHYLHKYFMTLCTQHWTGFASGNAKFEP